MSIAVVVQRRSLSAFIFGTLLIQGMAILVGLYLNATLPKQDVLQPTFSQFSDEQVEVAELFAEPSFPAPSFPAQEEAYASLGSQGLLALEEPEEAEEELGIPVEVAPLPEEPAKVVVHKIQPGESLSGIWRRHGGRNADAMRAAQAMERAGVKVSSLRAGDNIELQIDGAGDITGLKISLSRGRVLIIEGSPEGGYAGSILEPQVVEVEKTAFGTINSSFSRAAAQAALPYAVVDELVDLFGDRVEFRRSIQPGDTFSVVYVERQLEDGTPLESGPIKAASLHNGGKLLAVVRYTDKKGETRYYDENGSPVGQYFLRYPLKFTRISSSFSHRRLHPILKTHRPHHGVDFAAPLGTPIRSVADGMVEFVGRSGGAGNMVRIRHGQRYTTAYLHLHRFAPGLRKGSRVQRGQEIGQVGSTGLSTAPHLCFRLIDKGHYVDPLTHQLPRMNDGAEAVPESYLRLALDQLQQSHELLRLAALLKDFAQAHLS